MTLLKLNTYLIGNMFYNDSHLPNDQGHVLPHLLVHHGNRSMLTVSFFALSGVQKSAKSAGTSLQTKLVCLGEIDDVILGMIQCPRKVL